MSFSTPPPGPLSGAWLRLDRHGRVVHASSGAHELLAANADVLTLTGQHLLAPREPDRLDQMLRQWRGGGLGAAALTRDDHLPLTLLCQGADSAHHAGLAGPDHGDDGQAQGWLTLRDPEAERPDAERLRTLFGLTPCEAMVAAGLALGHSSADIAAQMAIQPNTVLTHVKRVLAKTGTRRQAQLVSLLLRSVAMAPLSHRPLAAWIGATRQVMPAKSVEPGMSLT